MPEALRPHLRTATGKRKAGASRPGSFSFVLFFAVLVVHLVAERNNHVVHIIITHVSHRPSDTVGY